SRHSRSGPRRRGHSCRSARARPCRAPSRPRRDRRPTTRRRGTNRNCERAGRRTRPCVLPIWSVRTDVLARSKAAAKGLAGLRPVVGAMARHNALLSHFFPGLRPFRTRDFALFWTGLSVSIVGDWMESTTTAWLLYDLTKSPLLLGISGGIRAVSTITFGLVGGAVADRFPRRRLLFITQSSFACTSLILGLLVVTGRVEFW